MQKNFFTVGEIAKILDEKAERIEDFYLSGRLDTLSTLQIEGIRLIPAWQLTAIKAELEAARQAMKGGQK